MNLDGLLFSFLNVTESAALASLELAGKGDNNAADFAAVEAMRKNLSNINAKITVKIGEGERDKAPMLYIGEKIGCGNVELDLAVDPLEGTNLCANYKDGAISVLTYGVANSILAAPDLYMEKIYTNIQCDIDIDDEIENNLTKIAQAKKCNIENLKVTILNRQRHEKLIKDARDAGAKVKLIEDGDISAILEIAINKSADLYIGIGGAPEGVLSGAAVKFLGGAMQAKLIFSSEEEKLRAKNLGISDFCKIYNQNSLVTGDVIFIATGITDSKLLKGIKITEDGKKQLESLIITKLGYSKTIRVFNI